MKTKKLKLYQFRIKSFITTIPNRKSIRAGGDPTVTNCGSNDSVGDCDTVSQDNTCESPDWNTKPSDRTAMSGGIN